jgi:formylglycine-generating enzyme required for sulfatase activity
MFPPNAWGLHDMHGNVWEWCADHYAPFTADQRTDPLVETTQESFVVRGGSWWNMRGDARSASRHSPTSTGSAVGLRVCLELE